MKVALVENADKVRLRTAEALSEITGIDLSICSTDKANLHSQVLQLQPDVVIVDVHQRSGGALELIRHLKTAQKAPVVIALSATSSIKYRASCHKAGAEYFFDIVREHERLTEAVRELQKELS